MQHLLMAEATLEHARSITHDIVKELDPLCVLLFGGVAREGRQLYMKNAPERWAADV